MNLLITLLIFSIPLGVITRIQIFQNVFLYLNDVIVGLIFVLFLQKVITKRINLDKKILYPLVGFFAIGSLSLLFQALSAQQLFVSFLYSLRYASYLSLIFIIPTLSERVIKSINIKLLLSGLIFILLGFIQYVYYPNLRNLNYLGWDEHEFRLFSTFLDPNFAGIYICLVFLLLLANVVIRFDFIKNTFEKTFLIVFSFLALIAIYLTHSRSALLSLLAGVAVFLFAVKKTKLILPLVILLFISQFAFSNFKAEGANPLRVVSAEARLASSVEAINIFSQSPIIGKGFDAYRYARIKAAEGKDSGSIKSNAGAGTDNSFLLILATTGIIGFMFFIKFLFEVVRGLYLSLKDLKKKEELVYKTAALCSIIVVLIDSLFINSLFYPLVIAWVFILIGVSLHPVVKSRNEKNKA